MDLDLNKGRANRGMENPLSAIFDLADDVSSYSRYVKKMVMYAIIFMLFWVFFNLILILQFISTGEVVPFTIFLGLLISGLVAFLLIIRTHLFFRYFTHRYNGIRTIRDSQELVKIPKGASPDERFFRFLQDKHPPLKDLLKREKKALNRDVKLKGASGEHYDFNIYISQEPDKLWKLLGLGQPGYGLYIKKFKGIPKMSDVLDIKSAVKDVAEENETFPSRIVLLYKYPKHFDGLSDDLYSFLVREEFKLELSGKSFYPVIQVVGETVDGYYDFTPLVPEFADRLP